MAIEKVIDIVVNKDGAVSGINDIKKSFEVLKKTAEDLQKEIDNTTDPERLKLLKKQLDDVNKSLAKTGKGFEGAGKKAKGLNTVIKGIGLSLKALGIGLVVGLLVKLGDVFGKNQKVVNFFNVAMIALEKVFSDLFDVVFKGGEKWVKFIKEAFENPQEKLKQFGDAIKENIEERFNSVIKLGGIFTKFFKKLFERDFKGAFEEYKNGLKELPDILTGVNNSYEKGTKAIEEGAKSLKEYAKETIKTANSINELRTNFVQLENQQIRIKEAADRDAELQRQIRDDYNKSISDRIKANDKLLKIIDVQEKAEIGSVQARINALKQEQKQLGFKQERDDEIYALNTEKRAIEAQQEGFRSEQELNRLALDKERIDLGLSENEAIKQRRIDELEFNAEQEKNELKKIEILRERIRLEQELIEEDIEYKKTLYKQDTQERVDAEQEYENAKQEIRQKGIQLDKQAEETKEGFVKKRMELQEALINKSFETANAIAKEGTKTAKGIAVAQATINTYQGITTELATKTVTPFEFGLKLANIASVTAIGFKSVRDILATDESGSSSLSGGGGSGSGIQAPSFNLVEGTGTNQIANTIQSQDKPRKTYVVGKDMTTRQELDRNTISTATL